MKDVDVFDFIVKLAIALILFFTLLSLDSIRQDLDKIVHARPTPEASGSEMAA